MKNFKWLSILTGVILIFLGIFVLTRPIASLASLGLWIAFGIFSHGIYEIVSHFSTKKENRNNFPLLNGILSIVIGLSLITSSISEISSIIPFLFAFWTFTSGVIKVFAGIKLNKIEEKSGFIIITLGILTSLFGLILIFNPILSYVLVIYLISFGLIIQGIMAITVGIKLN